MCGGVRSWPCRNDRVRRRNSLHRNSAVLSDLRGEVHPGGDSPARSSLTCGREAPNGTRPPWADTYCRGTSQFTFVDCRKCGTDARTTRKKTCNSICERNLRDDYSRAELWRGWCRWADWNQAGARSRTAAHQAKLMDAERIQAAQARAPHRAWTCPTATRSALADPNPNRQVGLLPEAVSEDGNPERSH